MIRKFTIDETCLDDANNPAVTTVGVSNHHIHLCRAGIEGVFCEGD